MYKLTALTKLILAIIISIASLITNDLYILSILVFIEIFTCFYLSIKQNTLECTWYFNFFQFYFISNSTCLWY